MFQIWNSQCRWFCALFVLHVKCTKHKAKNTKIVANYTEHGQLRIHTRQLVQPRCSLTAACGKRRKTPGFKEFCDNRLKNVRKVKKTFDKQTNKKMKIKCFQLTLLNIVQSFFNVQPWSNQVAVRVQSRPYGTLLLRTLLLFYQTHSSPCWVYANSTYEKNGLAWLKESVALSNVHGPFKKNRLQSHCTIRETST